MLTLASQLACTVAISVVTKLSINTLIRTLPAMHMAVVQFRMCIAIDLLGTNA